MLAIDRRPARPSIPEREVQVAVRPELDHAGVVTHIWLLELEDQLLICRNRSRPIVAGVEFGEPGVIITIGVVDEKPAVVGVIGMKSQAEEALLDTVRSDFVANVQK